MPANGALAKPHPLLRRQADLTGVASQQRCGEPAQILAQAAQHVRLARAVLLALRDLSRRHHPRPVRALELMAQIPVRHPSGDLRSSTNSPGANSNARSAARRARSMDGPCKSAILPSCHCPPGRIGTPSAMSSGALSRRPCPQRKPPPPRPPRTTPRACARRRRGHWGANPRRDELGATLAPGVCNRHQPLPALRRTASCCSCVLHRDVRMSREGRSSESPRYIAVRERHCGIFAEAECIGLEREVGDFRFTGDCLRCERRGEEEHRRCDGDSDETASPESKVLSRGHDHLLLV